ncbi:MAG: putative Fe-S cluster assembly protein SufT [Candidatus Eiseniibacteriota bacterium]
MRETESLSLSREVEGVLIPAGTRERLPAGTHVLVTQILGGNYTVMTVDGTMYRVDGKDADALGREVRVPDPRLAAPAISADGTVDPELVWDQLRTVYDPEIPVNIVDLGLVYRCELKPHAEGGQRVEIDMTMTAPGCGMGEFLKQDVEQKLLAIPGLREVAVEIVWEPMWSLDMMSDAARLQLGML